MFTLCVKLTPTLSQHPAERGKEEEVERHSNCVAEAGVGGCIEADQEQEMCQKQTAAQVGVDSGWVTLETRHTAENPDTWKLEYPGVLRVNDCCYLIDRKIMEMELHTIVR